MLRYVTRDAGQVPFSGLPLETLREKINGFQHDGGAWRDNLATFLGPELCAHLHLVTMTGPGEAEPDSIEELRVKVIWQLRGVVQRAVTRQTARRAVTVALNLTPFPELREMTDIEDRAEWCQKRHQWPSRKTIGDYISLTNKRSVLPLLAEELSRPLPVPSRADLDAIIAEFDQSQASVSVSAAEPSQLPSPIGVPTGSQAPELSPTRRVPRLIVPVAVVVVLVAMTLTTAFVVNGAGDGSDLDLDAGPAASASSSSTNPASASSQTDCPADSIQPVSDSLGVSIDDAYAISNWPGGGRVAAFSAEDVGGRAKAILQQEEFPEVRDMVEAGGYLLGGARIKLSLEGKSNKEVTIFNIRPIIQRMPQPLAAVIDGDLGGGNEDNIEMQFILDDSNPVGRRLDESGAAHEPYFKSNHVGLTLGEKVVLGVEFRANLRAYNFTIAVDYEVDQKIFTYCVSSNDHTQVFRAAADPCRAALRNGLSQAEVDQLRSLRYQDVRTPGWNDQGQRVLESIDPSSYAERCAGYS